MRLGVDPEVLAEKRGEVQDPFVNLDNLVGRQLAARLRPALRGSLTVVVDGRRVQPRELGDDELDRVQTSVDARRGLAFVLTALRGGDGGRGGDIEFVCVDNLNTLIDFRYKQHFKAGRGTHGMGRNRSGPKGKTITIKVPVGTQILSEDKEEVLADMTAAGETKVFLSGGDGGRGQRGPGEGGCWGRDRAEGRSCRERLREGHAMNCTRQNRPSKVQQNFCSSLSSDAVSNELPAGYADCFS